MITIEAKEAMVQIGIQGTGPVADVTFRAQLACWAPSEAALVAANLNQALRSQLKAIRAEAYRQGLADGRSRKRIVRHHPDGWPGR